MLSSTNTRFRQNVLLSAGLHVLLIVVVVSVMYVGYKVPPKPIVFMEIADIPGVASSAPSPSEDKKIVDPGPATPELAKPAPPQPQPEPQPVDPAPAKPQPVEPLKETPAPTPKADEPTITKVDPKPTAKPVEPTISKVEAKPVPKVKETTVKTPVPKKPEAKPAPAEPVHKIVVSTKTVTRTVSSSTANAPTTSKKTSPPTSASGKSASLAVSFDPDKFVKQTLGKMPVGSVMGPEGSASGQTDQYAGYFSLIFKAMYEAWVPPAGLPEGLSSLVKIRIQKNGTISQVTLATASGTRIMDESAVAAANRVKKLSEPLPAGLGADYADITVNFKLQK